MGEQQVADFETLADGIRSALLAGLQSDAVFRIERGYMDRAHVKVVSERFNDLSEEEKQHLVWQILRDALGEDALRVAFVLPYGTDEL